MVQDTGINDNHLEWKTQLFGHLICYNCISGSLECVLWLCGMRRGEGVQGDKGEGGGYCVCAAVEEERQGE